jgi:hypothetical protein
VIDHTVSKSEIYSNKLAPLEFENNQLAFNEALKNYKIEVLIQMNESLSLVTEAQMNHENFPERYKNRLEMIIDKMAKKAADFNSTNDEPKAPECLNMVSRVKLLERVKANQNAQELLLALIEHVSEVSGPQKLCSMVTKICGSAAFSQTMNNPLGVEHCKTKPTTTTVKQDNVTREFIPSLRKYLESSSFDYVLNDSGLSQKLAQELQVPSFSPSEQDIERGASGKVPWRCCPALEIELWKSENCQIAELVQDVFHALEEEGQETAHTGTYSKPDRRIRSDRITSLISYIEKLQGDIDSFCSEVWPLMQHSISDSNRSLRGPAMLSFVKNGIEELINDNHSLAKRLGRFEPALSQLFPEARDIAGEVQELLRTHTETAKENKSLRKSIMTKDRKLAEHEAEGLRTRDFRSAVRRS